MCPSSIGTEGAGTCVGHVSECTPVDGEALRCSGEGSGCGAAAAQSDDAVVVIVTVAGVGVFACRRLGFRLRAWGMEGVAFLFAAA